MKIDFIEMNPMDAGHTAFLFQLFGECADILWPENHRDIFANIYDITRRPLYFIVAVDGAFSGYIGIDTDNLLEGACLKKYRRFYPARQAVYQFCKMMFRQYEKHKIKAKVVTFNRPAEKVLRSVGFKKEGTSIKELLYRGKYRDAVNLYVFPSMLKVNHGRKVKTASS